MSSCLINNSQILLFMTIGLTEKIIKGTFLTKYVRIRVYFKFCIQLCVQSIITIAIFVFDIVFDDTID